MGWDAGGTLAAAFNAASTFLSLELSVTAWAKIVFVPDRIRQKTINAVEGIDKYLFVCIGQLYGLAVGLSTYNNFIYTTRDGSFPGLQI